MEDQIVLLCISLVKLTLFSLMLSLGLSLNLEQIFWLWQRPGLLNRSILGINVVVPIVAVLMVFWLSLPKEVEVGLILIAIAPGTSLTLSRFSCAGKNQSYAVALQITVSLLAVISVPLTIAILSEILPREAHISSLSVAQQIAVAQLLPLITGITVRQCWSDLADNLEKFVTDTANTLFHVLIIWIMIRHLDGMLRVGVLPLALIGLLAFISLVVGHLLGGRESSTRTTLAMMTATHNVTLALFIAALNFPSLCVSSVMAAYVLVSAGLAIIYLTWRKRKISQNAA
ncbi:bile acid:sodium symporter family protein [Fischerella sp. PCC 9605]|uniref:bile acid:sodium symporter family protein n=1 Tax=Fischerella sp. PCC 9605 TaxID=1173024 RepID=UPI00047CB6FF|nr:hypothetical protein [Fischerella sp. PCC 9605]